MKWMRQSFIFISQNPRESLILAIATLATLYISSLLYLMGTATASIGFVFIQAGVFNHCAQKPLFHFPHKLSLLLLALISVPTNILMGSVIGLLQGSDSLALSLSIIIVFSIFCALSYLLTAHAVGFVILKNQRFEPAMNSALGGFRERRWLLFTFSCLSAALLLVSLLPWGAGLILTLPLHFLAYHFSFQELYNSKNQEIDEMSIS